MARKTKQGSGDEQAPKKKRWYHQLWDVYQMARSMQPSITWWLLGMLFGIIILGFAIGFLFDRMLYVGLLSIPIALMVTMIFMSRRAERAAYARIEGTPGAAGSALGTIRRGWSIEDDPVAIDPRHQDVVFRAIGKPGVVLIGEGPPHRVGRLLAKEQKKVNRVAPDVTVHLIEVGRQEGQVPLPKLTKKVQRLRNTLTKAEIDAISKRLRALGHGKPPIPKGVDPMRARPDRRAMKGR